MLDTVSYSEFRAHMEDYLDKLSDNSAPLVVKRRNGQQFLIRPMDETEYLLASPANAKALYEALHSDPATRTVYKSVDELRKKFDI